jgi:hypothetical protein
MELVWILTTKHKSLEQVENFERYIIFSLSLLVDLLFIKQFTPWIIIIFELFHTEP